MLSKQTYYFLKHTFIKCMQSKSFTQEKESLQNDENKVVIQVDFAENFTTQIQNAIQSSYWVSKQFTLFTVCAWEKYGCHSVVVASDYLLHNKYAVLSFLSIIVDHLESNIRKFSVYEFFSDGASAHFKQRFTMSGITLLDHTLSWSFFATSHGKGAVDAIGGRVKRDVITLAMTKGFVVKTLDDFVNAAIECCPSITIIQCSKQQVESSVCQIDSDMIDCLAIPHTLQTHRVEVISP